METPSIFFRVQLLLFLLTYFIYILGYPIWKLKKSTGISTLQTSDHFGMVKWNTRFIYFGLLLLALIGFNFVFFPERWHLFGPLSIRYSKSIQSIGIVLLWFGSVITIRAQWEMKNSWRMAYNSQEKTKLVTNGLFKYSRNPIYLGLIIAFMGFAMITWSIASICFILGMLLAIRWKISLEEKYLQRQHGEDYQRYSQKVGRWWTFRT